MKVDKIYAETRKLTTEEKASAKLIFQYFLVMYADKKHHILLRDGEDTFVHFTSHFGMKFIKDNNLQFNAEGFAKANNALNYANMHMGLSRLKKTIDKIVKPQNKKSAKELNRMQNEFKHYLTNVTAEQWTKLLHSKKMVVEYLKWGKK